MLRHFVELMCCPEELIPSNLGCLQCNMWFLQVYCDYCLSLNISCIIKSTTTTEIWNSNQISYCPPVSPENPAFNFWKSMAGRGFLTPPEPEGKWTKSRLRDGSEIMVRQSKTVHTRSSDIFFVAIGLSNWVTHLLSGSRLPQNQYN